MGIKALVRVGDLYFMLAQQIEELVGGDNTLTQAWKGKSLEFYNSALEDAAAASIENEEITRAKTRVESGGEDPRAR